MVKVIPYHIPCNNNAVSHRGVIWHYYYMGCDMAKTKCHEEGYVNFTFNSSRRTTLNFVILQKKKEKNTRYAEVIYKIILK